MRIAIAVGLLACAMALAGAASAQARPAAKAAHGRYILEGVWRVNFIIPMETPAGAPPLVVSEEAAKPIAKAAGKAMADFFVASLDPEFPMLVPLSDGLLDAYGVT